MFFHKRAALDTLIDHFLHRTDLSRDERSVLDVLFDGRKPRTCRHQHPPCQQRQGTLIRPQAEYVLDAPDLENIVEEFLKQRPDMKTQPLCLCAVMAVMQRFKE